MTIRPEQWDARINRLSARLPQRGQSMLGWIREPSRLWIRMVAGFLLVLGGIFSILPILGIWMLPLGLALIAQDVPGMKVPLEKVALWTERQWTRLTQRNGSSA